MRIYKKTVRCQLTLGSYAQRRGPHLTVLLLLFIFFVVCPRYCLGETVSIRDDGGQILHFDQPPTRIVSVMPSATELIVTLEGRDQLVGITWHSASLFADKTPGDDVDDVQPSIVGGFLSPSPEKIKALRPELVIVSPLQKTLIAALKADNITLLMLQTTHLADSVRHTRLLGALLGRNEAAEALVKKNQDQFGWIAQKVAKIPMENRKRVLRLMGVPEKGSDTLMTVGSDSFQNELIRMAGGIAPDGTETGGSIAEGALVPMSREQYTRFNPDAIYYCGGKGEQLRDFLGGDGWNSVPAVRNGQIYSFPCDLTCRAAGHVGYFASWLSSLLYSREFADPAQEVRPREVIERKAVQIDLDFVKQAEVRTSVIHDFANRSLVIDFTSPRTIVSTLEGQRSGIIAVGNHYSPPPCWALNHASGLAELKQEILPVLSKDPADSSFLFTGADMNHLAVARADYRDMTVYALVTAGVRGNAQRMARDIGAFYEPASFSEKKTGEADDPGTINMIFLSNMQLSPRAMTRAIIAATEAKSAALQDLDIRSSYQPLSSAATGTGTDNIIVVMGDGAVVDGAGGHTKLGELIARTAYQGVQEAIARQNGIGRGRDIFERLRDRHLNVKELVRRGTSSLGLNKEQQKQFALKLEQTLLEPRYAGFLETAFAVSDGADRQTIADFTLFQSWCLEVAGNLAGLQTESFSLLPCFPGDGIAGGESGGELPELPAPLCSALNALFTGISEQLHQEDQANQAQQVYQNTAAATIITQERP